MYKVLPVVLDNRKNSTIFYSFANQFIALIFNYLQIYKKFLKLLGSFCFWKISQEIYWCLQDTYVIYKACFRNWQFVQSESQWIAIIVKMSV